jgi:hypothetical protein
MPSKAMLFAEQPDPICFYQWIAGRCRIVTMLQPKARPSYTRPRSLTLPSASGCLLSAPLRYAAMSVLRSLTGGKRTQRGHPISVAIDPHRKSRTCNMTLPKHSAARRCISAWNKDPVFGVIGIQSGQGSTAASIKSWKPRLGCWWWRRLRRFRRAYFVDGQPIKRDLPGAWRIAQGGPQGHPFRGGGVQVHGERRSRFRR